METVNTYSLVSVVIPVFNRAYLLEKAIRSVLDQTYPFLEIIIADDGSVDHPEIVVKRFRDARIKYIRLEHTGHIGVIRNAGAAIATGQWIAFLDSDDTWHPEKLLRQIERLAITGRTWCYCGFTHVDETGKRIPPKAGKYKAWEGWITRPLLTHDAAVVVCTLIVNRDLFLRTGGFSEDPRLTLRGDYEFALRLSQHAEASAVADDLVFVLEHEGRVTNTITDPHARSMIPYLLFLEKATDPGLRRIAHQQVTRLIRESAGKKKKSFLQRSSLHVRRMIFPGNKTAKLS